ncbi:MAG: carboxymuconolactone decarboxylase family protein [Acidimicrobiales bacterium]
MSGRHYATPCVSIFETLWLWCRRVVSIPETYPIGGLTLSHTRIEPLVAPYDPDVDAQLAKMMPAGAPPIALFRTFAHNMPMAQAMGGWGSYELSKRLSLSMRQRELVIDRVTARCGCEYEWGVHVAFFADRVDLSPDQVKSLTHGAPENACWTSEEAILLRAVDELHDNADLSDETWTSLSRTLSTEQILDLLLLAGWYHAISFAANGARVPLEDGVPRFADFL